jgi:hypothetical protein
MYNNSDKYWFNQSLFFHHDRTEGTEATLSLTATSSSDDLIVLGNQFLSIRISNHLTKSCLLKIQDVYDLYNSVETAFKNQNASDLFKNELKNTILKRYNKKSELVLDFRTNNSGYPVVKVTIRSNESDFTAIVVKWEVFKSFLSVVNSYKTEYPSFINVLYQQMIAKKLSKLDMIDNSIRGLYSSFESSASKPISNVQETESSVDVKNASWSSDMSEEFEKFVKDTDVDIPEVSKDIKKAEDDVKQTPVEKIDSELFNLIEKDLSKFEPYIRNNANVYEFINDLKDKMKFDLIPSNDDDEIKSLIYLSTYYLQLLLNGNTLKNEIIPNAFPIMKFVPSRIDKINLDLAYDLLLIQCYFRTFRLRLESKIMDSNTNYSRFHLALRMFTDCLIYGFIQDYPTEQIKSIIINRYKYWESVGAFGFYKKKLESSICPPIEISDISNYLDELIPNAKGFDFIKKTHADNQDNFSLKLAVENSFNLEQIIKEVIPLEVDVQLGNTNLDFTGISPEVQQLFKNKESKPKKSTEKKKPKLNVIQTFISRMSPKIDDEKLSEGLIAFLENHEKYEIDFTEFPFNYEDFNEKVLQGLYIWNPKIHKNFTSITNDLDTAPNKKLIIAQIKKKIESKKEVSETFENVDWNLAL